MMKEEDGVMEDGVCCMVPASEFAKWRHVMVGRQIDLQLLR